MTKSLVMIIDDENKLVHSLAYGLHQAGFDTCEAYSGISGIETARHPRHGGAGGA